MQGTGPDLIYEALPERVDVAVVGGGVIGLATALAVARSGASVAVLEGADARPSPSVGNAGQLRFDEVVPLAGPGAIGEALRGVARRGAPVRVRAGLRPGYLGWLLRFARASRAPLGARMAALAELGHLSATAFERFAAAHLDRDSFRRAGVLDVYETAAGLERGRREAREAGRLGFACDVVGGDAALELDPALRRGLAGAVHRRDDCSVDPGRFLEALQRAAVAEGVHVAAGAEATGLVDRTVRLAGGRTVEAGAVVLAAGARSPALLHEHGVHLPIVAGRGVSVDVACAEPAALASVFIERHLAATPLAGRIRVSAGMLVGARSARVPAGAPERLAAQLREILPGARPGAVLWRWAGLRPLTPDGLPLIGPLPRLPGVVVAGGHAMLGLTYALGTGELVADLLAGRSPGVDPGCFAPARF